jgi:hypothetical protein
VKKILYAGGGITTTDEVADAVLRLAAALANASRAEELQIPALDEDGEPNVVRLVIGPASQLMSEHSIHNRDLDDAPFLRYVTSRIESLTG